MRQLIEGRATGRLVLVAVLLAALAGCSEDFRKGTGACDPGVSDIGGARMTYPGMC